MAKIYAGNFSEDYDFQSRYRAQAPQPHPPHAILEARKNFQELAERNLALLEKPIRAEHIKYFHQVMASPETRLKELMEWKAKGGKVVGLFCVQVPEELIISAGAIAIRMECGFIGNLSASEEAMPSNVCPLCRSSVGAAFNKTNPFFDLLDVVIIPTTCDCKKKMAEVLSNYAKVWVLELPQNRDNLQARDYFFGHIKLLVKKLEKLTGRKITRKALESSIKLLQQRTRVFRVFLDIRKQKQIVISGRDSMLIAHAAFIDDPHRWTWYLDGLNKELLGMLDKQIKVMPENTPRMLVTGSPIIWPAWKVLNTIEESGALVAIDDSCGGTQYLYNIVEVPDWSMMGMLTALADKYLLPTVCPVFVHSDDRIDRLLELRSQFRADGVIYHLLRLCQCIDMEYGKVQAVLKDRGIPVLRIETEYGEEDVGQIKTRIEAFIEMVNAKKEK